jgi:hypothetical protein
MLNVGTALQLRATPPAPAPGVRFFPLEHDGILFDEIAQKLFHLNTMAAVIWCHVESRRPIESIASSIANDMRVDPARAGEVVRDILLACSRLGLLDGSRRDELPPSRPATRPMAPTCTAAPTPAPVAAKMRYYRVLNSTYGIRYYDSATERLVHPTLAHLESSPTATDALDIDIVGGERWQLLHGGTVLGSCQISDSPAPLAQGILCSLALRHYPYLLALHAGGVALGDNAMLLIGGSGSGKTTLSAALLAAGWDYLSDDMILMGGDELQAVPMPYSLGIKPGGWKPLASRFRGHRPRQHRRPDGQRVAYLAPPRPRQGFFSPRTVRWVVFPSRVRGTAGDLRSLGSMEGIARTMQHCCGLPRDLSPADIRRLVGWGVGVRWFEMSVGDLDTAVACLRRIERAAEHS